MVEVTVGVAYPDTKQVEEIITVNGIFELCEQTGALELVVWLANYRTVLGFCQLLDYFVQLWLSSKPV